MSNIHLRGFGSMNKERMREIASMGGKRAQELGTAHRFTSKEAVKAGKKGGAAIVRMRGKKYMSKIGKNGGLK